MNKNNQLAIKILDLSEEVYFSQTDMIMYFYVKDIETIKINLDSSHHVDLTIAVKKNDIVKSSNLTLGNIEDCSSFLSKLYLKHEKTLNYNINSLETYSSNLNKILSTKSIDNFTVNPLLYSVKLSFLDGETSYEFLLTDSYNSQRDIIFNPLEPITLNCVIQNKLEQVIIKKIIPAYQIDSYPILKNYIKTNTSTNDFEQFIINTSSISETSSKTLNYLLLSNNLNENRISKKTNKI